jgi:hypothetical protein
MPVPPILADPIRPRRVDLRVGLHVRNFRRLDGNSPVKPDIVVKPFRQRAYTGRVSGYLSPYYRTISAVDVKPRIGHAEMPVRC